METKRRDDFKREYKVRDYATGQAAFSCRMVCAHCNKIYTSAVIYANGSKYWTCTTKKKESVKKCASDNVYEETLHKAFIQSWNNIVKKKDDYMKHWERLEKEGNELERVKARQMRAQVEEGMITNVVDEHVRLVLDRVIVYSKNHFEIRFLDGSVEDITVE